MAPWIDWTTVEIWKTAEEIEGAHVKTLKVFADF